MSGAGDISRNLDKHIRRRVAGLEALASAKAMEMEAFAKAQARWRDRTANARQGLKGSATTEANHVVIRLSHQVDYGIYLEKSRSGRYAIIKPTTRHFKPSIKQALTTYWKGTKF